jgi:hypothetical protein
MKNKEQFMHFINNEVKNKKLYLSILLAVSTLLIVGCVQSSKEGLKRGNSIDYADYLPNKSTGVPGKFMIIVKGNRIIIDHASYQPIAYTEGFKIGKEYIIESLTEVDLFKIKRHVSVGDVTTTTIDKTGSKKRCVLVEKLDSLTHRGEHYSGDIIHEKCTGVPFGKYDRYYKKGVGEIALVRYSNGEKREIPGYETVANSYKLKEKK